MKMNEFCQQQVSQYFFVILIEILSDFLKEQFEYDKRKYCCEKPAWYQTLIPIIMNMVKQRFAWEIQF